MHWNDRQMERFARFNTPEEFLYAESNILMPCVKPEGITGSLVTEETFQEQWRSYRFSFGSIKTDAKVDANLRHNPERWEVGVGWGGVLCGVVVRVEDWRLGGCWFEASLHMPWLHGNERTCL